MNTILRTLLSEWREQKLPEILPREEKLEIETNPYIKKVAALTGFRRVGKTYILFDLVKRLLNTYSRAEVVYLNFEDERIPEETKFLSDLIPEIQSFYGKKPRFLFLDELQNIPLWSKWLRRVLDKEEIQIFVTGSSSKMSSIEIPTELRGRFWEKKIYPLSLKEFLSFKQKEIDFNNLEYNTSEKAVFNFLFEEYLIYGGLPEVVLSGEEKKLNLLQGYFTTVVKKDITERFKIKNEVLLKTILIFLLNSTSFTISKLYNNLKSMGIGASKMTLNNYVSNIESSYFFNPLEIYSKKLTNRLMYPRKTYFIDNGFITALSSKFSKNYGRLLENWVVNTVRQKNSSFYYAKNPSGKEIDLMELENEKIKTLYQVCYDLSDEETRKRETSALLYFGEKWGVDDLQIVTPNIEAKGINKKIKLIAPWKL